MPRRRNAPRVLTLTDREWWALAEAVRLSQQVTKENAGKLDPTLSRIQRKMGEEPGTD